MIMIIVYEITWVWITMAMNDIIHHHQDVGNFSYFVGSSVVMIIVTCPQTRHIYQFSPINITLWVISSTRFLRWCGPAGIQSSGAGFGFKFWTTLLHVLGPYSLEFEWAGTMKGVGPFPNVGKLLRGRFIGCCLFGTLPAPREFTARLEREDSRYDWGEEARHYWDAEQLSVGFFPFVEVVICSKNFAE